MSREDLIRHVLDGVVDKDARYEGYLRANFPRIQADFSFICTHTATKASILDIGAVPPLLTVMLAKRGFQRLHIVDPKATDFHQGLQKSGIEYSEANVLKALPADLKGRFDLVCLNEVIEHLAGNLLSALHNAIDCVAPGGQLMVTTPNLRSLSGLAALWLYGSGLASKPREGVRAQFERASAADGYYGHIREYTPREVIELLDSFGFRCTAVGYQANYLRLGRVMDVVSIVERCAPPLRLFVKYMFERRGD